MKENQQIMADIKEAIHIAAQEYAAKKMCAAMDLSPDCINHTDALIPKFCGMDIAEAFAAGVEWALKRLDERPWFCHVQYKNDDDTDL